MPSALSSAPCHDVSLLTHVQLLCARRGEQGVSFSESLNRAAAYEPPKPFDSDAFDGSPAASTRGNLLSLLQVTLHGVA